MEFFKIPDYDFPIDDLSSFKGAVKQKDKVRINELITKESVGKHDRCGDTFLHVVAKEGTIETATRLLKFGSKINVENGNKQTPLFYAIQHSLPMFHLLLDNSKDKHNNWKLLNQALLFGSEEIIGIITNYIIKEYSSHNANSTENSKGCFHGFSNTEEMIRVLLHKIHLFKKEESYPFLIFFVAKMDRKDFLQLILDDCGKCLKHLKEKKSETKKGKIKKNPPASEIDFQGPFDETALHHAVRGQLPEVVKFLLTEGANPNSKSYKQFTPLHYAAALENLEICKILLKFGASVKPNMGLACEPLNLVCGKIDRLDFLHSCEYYYDVPPYMDSESIFIFNLEIMKLLLENGANPDSRDQNEPTPFLDACEAGNMEVAQLLLKYGASLKAKDYHGKALHHAAIGGSIQMVDFLLEKGLKIDLKNESGHTPLMEAAVNVEESVEIIEYLVDRGANIDKKNNEKETALHIAIDVTYPHVVECLLELGANWSPKEKNNLFEPPIYQGSFMIYFTYIALKEKELGKAISLVEGVRYFQNAKCEIQRLKSKTISKELKINYFDFLTRDFYSTVQISKNPNVRKIFTSGEYKKSSPIYSFLLEKRFRRIETLEITVDETFNFFLNNETFKLPILVVEKILQYLRTIDFRVFGRALSGKRF